MMCNNNWNLDSTTWQSNSSAQQVFNGQHPTVASTQLYNHLQPQYTNHPQHLSNITPLNNLHYPFHLQHNQFQQSIQLPPISQLPSYSANYQPPVANYQPLSITITVNNLTLTAAVKILTLWLLHLVWDIILVVINNYIVVYSIVCSYSID